MNLKTFFEGKINLYTHLEKTQVIDSFEVHPVRATNESEGFMALEQCEESEAQIWSVYAHYIGHGLTCIADLPTKQEAETFAKLLTDITTYQLIRPLLTIQ